MKDNDTNFFQKIGVYLHKFFLGLWKEGFTVIFETKLREEDDPITGTDQRPKTSIKIKGGTFDFDDDLGIDYLEEEPYLLDEDLEDL